ncbi:MAG: acyl carrier protein [Pricia sp.]|nr:acyl carrier protein [Pricia sp.]
MTQEQRYQKLKDIIKIYLPEDVSVDDITMESHFIDELNINSANLVDIILDVEDEFDITLENEDMDKMQRVEDALKIIEAKLGKDQDV